jgi:hypothetical protein
VNRLLFCFLAFVASWFAVFFFAVLYEALKTLRDYLARRNSGQQTTQTQAREQVMYDFFSSNCVFSTEGKR